jgi:RNA polymerase sigma-70 factor (ECF subfamily)
MEAWERFVRLYTPLLLLWARREGMQEIDADDVIQEVFLKLLRQLPGYSRGDGQSFRGWLRQVTANECRDFRRRKATRALGEADGLPSVTDHCAVSDPEEAEDQRLLVHRGLDLVRTDFNAATWAAFTGLIVEGRPAPEVASALNLSVNAVYLARHRVLTRLRQELDGLLE